MNQPLVTICIPAYKQVDFVKRALESVREQDYRPLEVIVSDDSPDGSLEEDITMYRDSFFLTYQHNLRPLGSPRNWNQALSQAKGDYVLLLHQDDWLSEPSSIHQFVDPFLADPKVNIVFGRSKPVDRQGREIDIPEFQQKVKRLIDSPDRLILGNLLGHPSNVMVRNGLGLSYDARYVWLVDLEYYRRVLLLGGRSVFLDRILVEVGLHPDQITNSVGEDRVTLLREHLLFAEGMGEKAFQNLAIYDHYWRLFRNQGVRDVQTLRELVGNGSVMPVLAGMISRQRIIPPSVLQNGVCSKTCMGLAYLQQLVFPLK
jgi:glycosyltransferase involved in cell wall biosynthesis